MASTDQLLEELIKQIKQLPSAISKGIGGGGMSSSYAKVSGGGDSTKSAKDYFAIINKGNQAYLDAKKKIDEYNKKQLIAEQKEFVLEEKRLKILQREKELAVFKNKNRTTLTKEEEKQLKLTEKRVKEAYKEFRLSEREINAANRYLKQNQDINKEIEKKNAIEAKQLKQKEKLEKRDKDEKLKTEFQNSKQKEKEEKENNKYYERDRKRKEAVNFAQQGILDFGMKILNNTLNQDSAIAKLSANYALSKNESRNLKDNITNIAFKTNLIGVNTEDLVKMQGNYTNELGRAVMLSEKGMVSLAEMGVATGIGAEGAGEMAAQMDVFGLGVQSTYEKVGDLMNNAKKSGLSASVITGKMRENMKIANSYTFKDGVDGLARTTIYSEKLRINMSSVASMADKLSNPEGAIEMGSKLQVLGGAFAQMSDPLNLLNQGLGDMEGLTETYSKMLDGIANIDKTTGEVTINKYDRLRVKAAAEATGVAFDEMMSSIRTKGKRTAITSDLSLNTNIKTEQDKDLIASLADFEKGKGYTVNIKGEQKSIAKISAEDLKYLQPDTVQIKDVAKNTQGLKEILEHGFESLLLKLTSELIPMVSDIAKYLQSAFDWFGDKVGSGRNQSGESTSPFASKAIGAGISGVGAGMLSKGLSATGLGLPIIGSLISGGAEYASSGNGSKAVGSGIGNLIGTVAGGALGTMIAPGAGTAIGAMGGGMLGSYIGKWMGGMSSANDLFVPSNGSPIKLNSEDEVFAMKPGGALLNAVSKASDYSTSFNTTIPNSIGGSISGSNNIGGGITLNIQGHITLHGGGGASSKIDSGELVKNQQFMRELTRMIGNQMNRDKNGGKYTGSFGNNSM
jgi:hypothetical protein